MSLNNTTLKNNHTPYAKNNRTPYAMVVSHAMDTLMLVF